MSAEDHIVFEGKVSEVLGGSKFRVSIDDSEESVISTLSGKIRKNKIRIILGDAVKVAVSTYDSTRGIIKFRYR